MLSSRDRGEVLQISPLLDGRENGESQDKARLASQKLTKKVRGNTCRTDSCVSLSEEPSGGTAGAPVLKNRAQQESLLGVGMKQKFSLKDCGEGLEEEAKPLGLPSGGGNDLYLTKSNPVS